MLIGGKKIRFPNLRGQRRPLYGSSVESLLFQYHRQRNPVEDSETRVLRPSWLPCRVRRDASGQSQNAEVLGVQLVRQIVPNRSTQVARTVSPSSPHQRSEKISTSCGPR